MPIRVRESKVHGQGVFAVRALKAGEQIGVFAGRRYPPGTAPETESDNERTYLFALSDGACIDGSDGGNATAHLNHSCEPNCEASEEFDEAGGLEIVFSTLRPIKRGEELFIDYALETDQNDDAEYVCYCRALTCRGTMAAPAGEVAA